MGNEGLVGVSLALMSGQNTSNPGRVQSAGYALRLAADGSEPEFKRDGAMQEPIVGQEGSQSIAALFEAPGPLIARLTDAPAGLICRLRRFRCPQCVALRR